MSQRFRFNLTFAILASLAALLLLTWLLLSIISFKTAEKDLLAAKRAHAASTAEAAPCRDSAGTLHRAGSLTGSCRGTYRRAAILPGFFW